MTGKTANMTNRIILDLCGGTGAWSKPYRDAGYDTKLITLPEYDVRLYTPPENVYGVLCAPPCEHFASSGSRWWKKKGERALIEGLAVVDACLRIILITKPIFWALENPVGRLCKFLGRPRFYFNPCDFGDSYTKKTCLWGEFNIPKLNPVEPVLGTKMLFLPPSKDRKMLRSITPQGFAKAFFEANR